MISEICNYDDCTGCTACFSICPKNAIEMLPDKEGFLRPHIQDDLCINCYACRNTCPVNNDNKVLGYGPETFAVRNRDDVVLEDSSSGGVFSALAITVIERGGVVFAAGFDKKFKVVHKECTSVDALSELRKSKYVQSRLGNVFSRIKELLVKGKEVLFCGTPCQIDGLIYFLKVEYLNLHTIDFICHGVPSPLAWEKYVNEISNKGAISNISFRSKVFGWKKYALSFSFEDGEHYDSVVTKDPYLRSFIMNMDLRPSCYNCHSKQEQRYSDITMADFWGVDKVVPKWNDDRGVSLILVNSTKGQSLLDDSKDHLEIISVQYCEAIAKNPSIHSSVKKPPLRTAFMRDLDNLDFEHLFNKYCGNSLASKFRRRIANYYSTNRAGR